MSKRRLLRLAFAATLAAAPAEAAGLRSFKDWTVGCDNARFCRAIGTVKGGRGSDLAYVVLDRDGGPNGAVRFISGAGLSGGETVHVDGKPVVTLAKEEVVALPNTLGPLGEADAGLEDNGVTDAELMRRIVEALLNGASLAFSDKPEEKEIVSLEGLKAALLWMDEQQGRVGTVTALAAKGAKPASAVPPAPPLPLVRRLPKAKQKENAREGKAVAAFHKRHGDKELCSDTVDSDDPLYQGIPLNRRQTAYSVYCWRAAYQGGVVYYVVDAGSPPRVVKAPFERLDEKTGRLAVSTAGSITDATESDSAGEIGHFHKGRGIGDCAESTVWRWDGKVFRLVHHSTMPICGGVSGHHWFPLWRSRDK